MKDGEISEGNISVKYTYTQTHLYTRTELTLSFTQSKIKPAKQPFRQPLFPELLQLYQRLNSASRDAFAQPTDAFPRLSWAPG